VLSDHKLIDCCSYPDKKSDCICPPPDKKAKHADDYKESIGALGLKYDPLMHFAIAHLRRVDGALPPLSNGSKALNLLAPANTHR